MKVLLEFYRAIYRRFEIVFTKLEGEKSNAQFSAVLLLSIFDVILLMLMSMLFELNNIKIIDLEYSERGAFLAFLSILPIVYLNWLLVEKAQSFENSRFVVKGKPKLAVDVFIISIVICLFFVSGMVT